MVAYTSNERIHSLFAVSLMNYNFTHTFPQIRTKKKEISIIPFVGRYYFFGLINCFAEKLLKVIKK